MALRIVLYVVGSSQLALGALLLIAPGWFLVWMGLSPPALDNGYMLAMLAARFLAYGAGMFWLARQPSPDRFWIRNMIGIQLIDFAAGAAYLASGVVTLTVVAFPMFNAALFAALLWLFQPPRQAATA